MFLSEQNMISPLAPREFRTLRNGVIAGNPMNAPRCNAKSKRSGLQCGSPAIKGKSKCRMHGGRSTGYKTKEGRKKIQITNTKHGLYSQTTDKIRLLEKINQNLTNIGRITIKNILSNKEDLVQKYELLNQKGNSSTETNDLLDNFQNLNNLKVQANLLLEKNLHDLGISESKRLPKTMQIVEKLETALENDIPIMTTQMRLLYFATMEKSKNGSFEILSSIRSMPENSFLEKIEAEAKRPVVKLSLIESKEMADVKLKILEIIKEKVESRKP